MRKKNIYKLIIILLLFSMIICGFSEKKEKKTFIGYVIDKTNDSYGHYATFIVESKNRERKFFSLIPVYESMNNKLVSDRCVTVIGDEVKIVYYNWNDVYSFEILTKL